MAEEHILSFVDVSFRYRGDWLQQIHALKQVNLAVPRGSSYGFLGANGAGKSTSIKLLVGLLMGHAGDIRLFNQPLGDPQLRRRIGYLPEQPYFYENLQVREYLAYLGQLSGMRGAELSAACERVYQQLDLGELRSRKLGSFSKGMRQRFGLAQAILHQPDLLILDEPFSGLDPLWRARFRQVMDLERKRGATLFFSSHILSDVEDLCDHYAVIDHGVVLEQGRLDQLMNQAPLSLTGKGPRPAQATDNQDGTWQWTFPEADRDRNLAEVLASGAAIVRLQRQRIALEDYFVSRVREFHGAGKNLEER
jgi:ABC-2 type transport system ATP-binding protein